MSAAIDDDDDDGWDYLNEPADEPPTLTGEQYLRCALDLIEHPRVSQSLPGLEMVEELLDRPGFAVPGAALLDSILACQRGISALQALQVKLTAGWARPGVAVPVSDVMDSLMHRGNPAAPGPAAHDPNDDDVAARAAAGHTVVGDPQWDAAISMEAAELAGAELGAALRVAPVTAGIRIDDALELVDQLPLTFHALQLGRIDRYRASVIAAALRNIDDPDLQARAERLIVDRAVRGMTPGDLGRLAEKVVADIDPAAANRRATKAHARRGTGTRSLGDGLARFYADMSAQDAAVAHLVLRALAAAVPDECRAGRGESQLSSDIFADIWVQFCETGVVDIRSASTSPTTQPGTTEADSPTDATVQRGSTKDAHPVDEDSDPVSGARPAEAADPADAEPTAAGAASVHSEPTGDVQESAGEEPASGAESVMDDDADVPAEPTGRVVALLEALRSAPGDPGDPNEPRRAGLLASVRLPRGLRVNLDVTVALSTLAGVDDLGARLEGHGVITAELARALTRAAGTVRLLLTGPAGDHEGAPGPSCQRPGDCQLCNAGQVDPHRIDSTQPGTDDCPHHHTRPGSEPDRQPTDQPINNGGLHRGGIDCGTVLDFGRTTYRVPTATEDRVKTRDQRCRFLGCGQPAARCQNDHHIPWDQGGASCPCDLDTLCVTHHRAKTFSSWHAIRHPDNTVTWTSPLGRRYLDQPAPDLPIENPPWVQTQGERGGRKGADETMPLPGGRRSWLLTPPAASPGPDEDGPPF